MQNDAEGSFPRLCDVACMLDMMLLGLSSDNWDLCSEQFKCVRYMRSVGIAIATDCFLHVCMHMNWHSGVAKSVATRSMTWCFRFGLVQSTTPRYQHPFLEPTAETLYCFTLNNIPSISQLLASPTVPPSKNLFHELTLTNSFSSPFLPPAKISLF